MAGTNRGPDALVLHGAHTQIIYRSDAGSAALLTFRDRLHARTFGSDEIRSEQSEIGALVTVTLEAIPDLDETTLTIVVPEVHMPDDQDVVPVEAVALLTTTRTSIGGPALVVGALESYRVIALHGTAYATADEGPCSGWTAGYVQDAQNKLTLNVRGSCQFPTPGWSATLRPHTPQGINPRDLLLDLITVRPTGIEPQHVVTVDIEYVVASDGRYESVTILPAGPSLTIHPAR